MLTLRGHVIKSWKIFLGFTCVFFYKKKCGRFSFRFSMWTIIWKTVFDNMTLNVLAQYGAAWVSQLEKMLLYQGELVSKELGIPLVTAAHLQKISSSPLTPHHGLFVKWIHRKGHSLWDSKFKYQENSTVHCRNYDPAKKQSTRGIHLVTLDCAVHFALREGILPHFQKSLSLLFCQIPVDAATFVTKLSFATKVRCSKVTTLKSVPVILQSHMTWDSKRGDRFRVETDPLCLEWNSFLHSTLPLGWVQFQPLPLPGETKFVGQIVAKSSSCVIHFSFRAKKPL